MYVFNLMYVCCNWITDDCCYVCVMYVQKDDKQPLLLAPPAHHNKISPHPDDNPQFQIDVSSAPYYTC